MTSVHVPRESPKVTLCHRVLGEECAATARILSVSERRDLELNLWCSIAYSASDSAVQ